MKSKLVEHWDAALEFLRVTEFPSDRRAIIPESIHLSSDDEWEMTFIDPKWEDGYWTVAFRGGTPFELREGD